MQEQERSVSSSHPISRRCIQSRLSKMRVVMERRIRSEMVSQMSNSYVKKPKSSQKNSWKMDEGQILSWLIHHEMGCIHRPSRVFSHSVLERLSTSLAILLHSFVTSRSSWGKVGTCESKAQARNMIVIPISMRPCRLPNIELPISLQLICSLIRTISRRWWDWRECNIRQLYTILHKNIWLCVTKEYYSCILITSIV